MSNKDYTKVMNMKIHKTCPPDSYALVIRVARQVKPPVRAALYSWIEKSRKGLLPA